MKSFPALLDKLPDIEEYKSNLESLKNIDFQSMSQREIHENVYKQTVILPKIPANFAITEFNKGTFYRVRKNIDPTKEDLTKIKTFGYPEPSFCSQNGRANIKGKSVFYCSDVAATSILESKPEQRDTIFLSVWQPDVMRDVKAITLCKSVKRLENGAIKTVELLKPLQSQISECGADKTEHLNYLNSFIGEYFVTEKEPYYFTSWFSDNILYQLKNIDCIHYQSCITSAFSNFAFQPTFIDEENLKLENVVKLETELISDRYLKYILLEIGETDGDKIKWRQLTEVEKANYHSIIKKGEEIILSNPLN